MKPNIIVILLDAASADKFSCLGCHRENTPNVDIVAQQGILYKNAFTPGIWTYPAMAGIFTGLYPTSLGILDKKSPSVPENIITLPEYLQKNGYRTHGIMTNAWISESTNLVKGFDQIDCQYSKSLFSRRAARVWGSTDHGASYVLSKAKKMIKTSKNNSSPFFLYCHFVETHECIKQSIPSFVLWEAMRLLKNPFLYSMFKKGIYYKKIKEIVNYRKEFSKYLQNNNQYFSKKTLSSLTAIYMRELAHWDKQLGNLYRFIRKELDNTIVVILADHGDILDRPGYFGHEFGVFDELLHIPLIISYPEQIRGGIVIDELVQSVGLFQTLISLCELPEFNGGYGLQGKGFPLTPEMKGQEYIFAHSRRSHDEVLKKLYKNINTSLYMKEQLVVRDKKNKLIINSDGTKQLYDIVEDPGENINKLSSEPEAAKSMEQHLMHWKKNQDKFYSAYIKKTEEMEFSEKVKKSLESLGYF